jgi:hypothetical protein
LGIKSDRRCGKTLNMVAQPDQTIIHHLLSCPCCSKIFTPFALMLAVVVRLILKSVCVFTVLRTVLELLISNTFSSINNPCTIIFNINQPPFALMLAVVVRLILKSVCVFTVLRTVLELLISNTFSSINNPCTIIFNINQPAFINKITCRRIQIIFCFSYYTCTYWILMNII